MKNVFTQLNLVQKVTVTMIVLFVVASVGMNFLVSQVIRNSYLNEQKRSVSQFVHKQATEQLSASDFEKAGLPETQEKFNTYRKVISTPDVVNITIFDSEGKVLTSDNRDLLGKQLSPAQLRNLAPAFGGITTTSIDTPVLAVDHNGSGFGQLLRMYIPVIFDDIAVVGVVETSAQMSSLNAEITRSQRYALGVVAGITSLTFIILFFIIRRASMTLVAQDNQLRLDIQKEQKYSELKSEFITMSSHQLRTPATSILWSLELLREKIENKLNTEQKTLINSAQTATKTLVSIVNNLLIVTNIKPDYFTYEAQNYSLQDLVREVLEKSKQYSATKNHHIILKTQTTIIRVNPKRSALSLVLESIVKNAIDYSPENSTITTTLTAQESVAQIEIEDIGIGIPTKERERVFEKFFRASNAIEQKNVGSGLSLYIAYQIVTGYGGTMKFTALAKGSKFTLSIPIVHISN